MNMRQAFTRMAVIGAALSGFGAGTEEWAQRFAAPPPETRPWCYWYWISDNLSKEGITRDLEAMARVGIGEALIGNIVDPDTPLGSVKLLSSEWEACMTHAAVEAKRLGVNIGVFNSPGWSQSGGPWVAPTQAMRYVAFSEARVKGPSRFEARLPAPKEPFQDIAALAFPAPKADDEVLRPLAVRGAPELDDPSRLCDGSPETGCALPEGVRKAGQSLTVDIDYAAPVTVRSLSVATLSGSYSARCVLLAADGAGGYSPVREFVMDRRGLGRPAYAVNVGFLVRAPTVVTFPAVTAKAFRLKITLLAVEGVIVGSVANATVSAPGLAEVTLSGAARLEFAAEKQLGKMHPTPLPDWASYLWPSATEPEPGFAVDPSRIVDLTGRLAPDGALTWDVPEGEWVILRAGMTPTGAHNHPTTDEGRGLEVDKMNRVAVEAHFGGFVGPYLQRVPQEARAAIKHVVIDSYEVGSQNWTDGFHETFQKAFGYDPRPWLPALSGRIVGRAGQTERFLWDLRRHIAERTGNEYVGGLRDIARRSGLRLWLENYGHWGFPGEFLQYGGQSDDLGGEFWIREGSPLDQGGVELRAASSAAHIYGKRPVFSEAFTSARSFLEAPGNIKTLGDWAFCQGINHFVLHVYIHQPWDSRKPGVNAWFGTEFNRHNTWFEPSKAWVDYLRRCHYLLQRGTSVADVAYFIGEDAPKMIGTRQPALPAGYDYDYVNAEVLLHRVKVAGGRLALPDGLSYALLVLPPQETMRPETMRRIRDLVAEGASILGPPPSRSPSLAGYPACDAAVAGVAAEVWGELAHASDSGLARRSFGRGTVYRGDDLAGALRAAGAEPAVVAPEGILWTHRREGDADIFFLSQQKNEPSLAEISFRVSGRVPEFWHPDSGRRETAAWFASSGGRARVPVALEPNGSVFVVFRAPASGASVARVLKDGVPVAPAAGTASPVRVLGAPGAVSVVATEPGRYTLVRTDGVEAAVELSPPPPMELSKPWKVAFPGVEGWETPTDWPALVSWHEHPDDRVKYFSGTATYTTGFELPAGTLRPGLRLALDLGAVDVIAEVKVNGTDVGTVWKRPFAIDITDAARPGENRLEVRVTNLWQNRLIGDGRQPPEARTTFTTARPRVPRKNLLPSGLLGPVRVRFEHAVVAEA
jgi:hypothetical protein